MPPKGSVKPKATAKASTGKAQPAKQPATPTPSRKVIEESESSPPSSMKAKPTPRSRKKEKAVVKNFNSLDSDAGSQSLIDVSFENETVHGKELDAGGYEQGVRLHASQPFKLIKSVMFNDGAYAGYQAVLIAPSKPMDISKLSLDARKLLYYHYLAPPSNSGGRIEFVNTNKGMIAKSYAANIKDRLALLRVNKEILGHARAILYRFILRFDKADTVLNFLTCAGEPVRALINYVEIVSYTKATAMPTMTMLAGCKGLKRVHIISGIGVNTTPDKAVKSFYSDASRFFQVVGLDRGDRHAGIDLLSFGSKCFWTKATDDEKSRPWDDDEMEEFVDALKAKLVSS